MPLQDLRTQELPVGNAARRFYAFEEQGRGWRVYEDRVPLEPPLIEIAHGASPVADNARIKPFWHELFGRHKLADPSKAPAEPVQVPAQRFTDRGELVRIQVALPPDLKVAPDAAESLLLSLTHCGFPLSFEIVGLGDFITIQFVTRASDRPLLEQQLLAHFPELTLTVSPDTLRVQWATGAKSVVVEFGLKSEFMRPLSTFRTFDPDPLISLTGALGRLHREEVAIFQVLFQAARRPWPEQIVRAVTNDEGKPLFIDAPDLPALTRQKIARPLYAAVVRVAANCASKERSWQVVRALGGALRRFANPASNELIALSNDGYPQSKHEEDLWDRATHRSGVLLNSEELAGLVHIPSASVRSEKLRRQAKKTRPAPALALGHSLVLGRNTHRGQSVTVTLSPEQRMRHVFIPGSTGSGKSTLLKNMAAQDIHNGDGCCIIDPHADLINDLLAQVPEERYGDVIIFDPSDECPVPFNVLSAHSELEKNLLASDLTSIFRRQCTTWGDQMDAVLTNAILAFLESDRPSTLADLRRFLIETEFRKDFLRSVRDEELIYYWTKEFPLLRGRPQAPILTRLNAFLRPKPIRAMVSQQSGSLDLRQIIDSKKILFVKLGQGTIGVENAQLLGSLVLSKLHQAALSRQEIDESDRTKVSIYVDECQYFLAPSVTALLSGGRKHGVGLVLATQEFFALWNADKEIASSVLTNPFARICFRLGDTDAKRLAEGFAHFHKDDLQNLAIGEAIVRLQTNENDFNLTTPPPQTIDSEEAKIRRQQITELSRKQYGRRPEQSITQVTLDTPRQSLSRSNTNSGAAVVSEVTVGPPACKTIQPSEQPITTRSAATLGRGGHEHKYLQHLIKRLADDQGFCVTIEQPVLGGTGSIDIILEKGNRKIACEISVTSTPDYELKNVEKCLAAGFDPVVVLSTNKRQLARIKKLAHAALVSDSLERVLFIQPDELPGLLEHYGKEDPTTETTVKGYKVKVKQRAITGEEAEIKKAAISKVLLKSLTRLRQDEN